MSVTALIVVVDEGGRDTTRNAPIVPVDRTLPRDRFEHYARPGVIPNGLAGQGPRMAKMSRPISAGSHPIGAVSAHRARR